MPKFVWVGEIIHGNKLRTTQYVESIVVLDATESGLSGHLIFATNSKYLLIKQFSISNDLEKNYSIFEFKEEKFTTFANNLKGEHVKWQI